MQLPKIIQGGMGVGVSDWRLARAVSTEGELGVVSGTALNSVIVRRLQNGDPGGHIRRALAHFVDPGVASEILASYFVEGGIAPGERFKRSPVPSVTPTRTLQRLNIASGFVEVWLAKEGHDGIVGINFLEKLQTSNLAATYGAMLAGVDYVLMGAGVPREIPGVLDRFSLHENASIKITLSGPSGNADVSTTVSPRESLDVLPTQPLKRPAFLAIISSSTLASHLVKKSTGSVEGFVIEGVLAGGHNAPPRGPMKLNERGEPIYGEKDHADLEEIRELGLPFWLAGSYGSPEKLTEAIERGAAGIQVGTAFAFCEESGVAPHLREAVISRILSQQVVEGSAVFTDPNASPTGFPFKVVQLPGTQSERSVYEDRPRKCDLGYLRQIAVREDGAIVYLCASEPVEDYVRKGGKVEDTVDRKCLCNALLANVGLGQAQEDGYQESPLLTAGDDLVQVGQFLRSGQTSYQARDVLSHLKRQ
ncbi:MAG: nitronate monooxygenase [Candidatus Kapabacteria bacterium]|nr:nitronate monooxygenase [Candidatus Kapabacteria bacterium]MBP7092427.1 nitronate monooxygenase [Candidatus Kapabacteria bacterium]